MIDHRPTLIRVEDRAQAEREAAATITDLVRDRAQRGESAVLGLATGRSPIGIYDRLASEHARGLSFANVTTFNLDEYWPIALTHPASFHRFMHERFFDRVDLPRGRRHVPNGSLPESELARHCADYEARIVAAGGIDLQLLGLGPNGHIGFNEPGSTRESRTRRVVLDASTRTANAAAFAPHGEVPQQALTMGIATILEARRIVLLCFGAKKAQILKAALEGPIASTVPASFLREHANVTIYADRDATALLR
ncbi:MAG: glucosamine-6-phosphate deaminase [Planctomycetes bacterium]|nr:glucosamine-6-phosphate deaminase [Planctomycetota bacterium]MCC7169881.1 glucosamine-6-phosphate deaminase [Planctomycetota bacterium]